MTTYPGNPNGDKLKEYTDQNMTPLKRISVIKEDRAYSPNARLFEIFLDGVQQRDVLTADEENGFVFRLKRTKFGILMINRLGKKVTETVKGSVQIKLKEFPNGN